MRKHPRGPKVRSNRSTVSPASIMKGGEDNMCERGFTPAILTIHQPGECLISESTDSTSTSDDSHREIPVLIPSTQEERVGGDYGPSGNI
ncbi:MAG: hypothetical protein ACD_58C00239G0002 [uncultured bacterium]|nr:MAG: hypothetical protein ACD_58C00239G0002 [uncultured bacterium]